MSADVASEKEISRGSCLCGDVRYEITGNLGIFQYCHCSRCRKVTGSAHAANIFVRPQQFRWLSGQDLVGQYSPSDAKYFSTAFCKQCGSTLPWQNQTGTVVIIGAGTLDDDPNLRPTQNIYCGSAADWYVEAGTLTKHETMPPRKR